MMNKSEGHEIDEVASRLKRRGIKTTLLNVSHAFHSSLMDPILEEFRTITDNFRMSMSIYSLFIDPTLLFNVNKQEKFKVCFPNAF